MTIFFPDVSGHQYKPEQPSDLSLKGALAVAIKVTEGTTFVNSAWKRAQASASSHGAYAFGYHMLHHGAGAAEAGHYHAQTEMPCMVDVELDGANVRDTLDFVNELRSLGGRVHPIYLPRWYWENLGQPDLRPLGDQRLFLWSSAYTSYTDHDSGEGWQSYGGMTPRLWQYTENLRFNGQSVDFSAFRGSFAGKQDPASVKATVAQLINLIRTGSMEGSSAPRVYDHVVKEGDTIASLAQARGMTPWAWLELQHNLGANVAELSASQIAVGLHWKSRNP